MNSRRRMSSSLDHQPSEVAKSLYEGVYVRSVKRSLGAPMANIAFLRWPLWERAASGRAVADPAMTSMKSRRIACPQKA
jgi:hypothetical protein